MNQETKTDFDWQDKVVMTGCFVCFVAFVIIVVI